MRCAFVLLSAALPLAAVQAQSHIANCRVETSAPTASVAIQVTDASGAAIPQAAVEARCGTTVRNGITAADGHVTLELRPGSYQVTARAPGFATLTQSISTAADRNGVVALTLPIAASNDVINVNADTGFVPYESNAGSKTNSLLIEVPQSISVVNQLEMVSRQVITMNEALRYTPGIQADEYGVESRFDWLKIRGFDAQTFGVFRDGMRFNSLSGKLDPFELESVEVLKGPSSILYGEVPPGGLINQVTKRPGAERSTTVEAQFGSYGRRQGALDTTGAFDREAKFRYRLLGLVRNAGTQVDYVPDNRRLIAPSFTYHPSDRTNFTVLADYQHDGTKWSQFLPASGTLYNNNPNGIIPVSAFTGEPGFDFVTREQASAGYTGDHLFQDGWNVHSNYRYQYINFKGQTLYGAGFDGASTTNLTRVLFATPNTNRYNTVDNRALRRFTTGRVEQTVLFGYDYQHVNQHNVYTFLSGASDLNIYQPKYGTYTVPAGGPYLNQNNLLQQHGLYAQDQIKFDRHLVLTVGGRQDFAKNDITHLFTGTSTYAHLDQRLTGRVGVTYLTDKGIAPYFAYSTSFLPNAGTYVYNSTTKLSTDPAKPSDARQIEGGVKIQPRTWTGFLTASVFQINETNVIVADSAFNSHQDGEVRSRGVELEGITSLSHGLNLHAGYTFTATNVVSSPESPFGVGHWLPQTPRNQFSALADYTQRGGRFAGVGGNFGVRFTGTNLSNDPTSSAAIGAPGNDSFYIPNYTLLDAGLRFGYRHTLFSVNATNLTDKRYVATCGGLAYCYYGYARNVVGSAKYHF
ncbi:MAG: TonB-dependent siderophore receptor [Janthinobacterium lividum]